MKREKSFEELTLTERQKQVLGLLSKGKSNKRIAEELYLSQPAIRFHLKNLYINFDVNGTHFQKRLKLALLGKETTQ